MPSQSTSAAEHMVCWTSVQYPHRLCVTALLQLAKLITVPVCAIHNTFSCVVHTATHVFTFVSFYCAMLSHILITVMSMQLLHAVNVQLLTPQCHAFI